VIVDTPFVPARVDLNRDRVQILADSLLRLTAYPHP
jgi:hypothetical protein